MICMQARHFNRSQQQHSAECLVMAQNSPPALYKSSRRYFSFSVVQAFFLSFQKQFKIDISFNCIEIVLPQFQELLSPVAAIDTLQQGWQKVKLRRVACRNFVLLFGRHSSWAIPCSSIISVLTL